LNVTHEPLAFYRHALPAIRDTDLDGLGWRSDAESARVFDARRIPINFLRDSGASAILDIQAERRTVRLPFDMAWFEFADHFGVLAREVSQHNAVTLTDEMLRTRAFDGTSIGEHIEFIPIYSADGKGDFDARFAAVDEAFGCIHNWVSANDRDDYDAPYELWNLGTGRIAFDAAAEALFGVLSLLSGHLIASEDLPDPAPALSKARSKRGQPPVTGPSTVLTLNLAAIRRAARRPAGSHESPCLHWRRGHERILHRGSEFEGRTWVRRCLVGDPSRGYAGHRSYQLKWDLPLIAGEAA
jgi:hypothetical protein